MCPSIVPPSAKRDNPRRAAGLDGADVSGTHDLGAELHRLSAGPLGELGPGDPVRKAEVVLDPRALARLTAGRRTLDQDGAQPFGRRVDGGPRPAGPPPTTMTS